MKTNLLLLKSCFTLSLAGPMVALSQPAGPVIASFGGNGELVCTNLWPGTTATVEWAPSVTGPWTNTWAGLDTVMVETNGTVRLSVPMFYRVRGMPGPDPTKFVLISPGTFTMGSPSVEKGRGADEGPQTTVTITREFWMGKYEVTQGEYEALIGNNPSLSQGGPNASRRPVESVTWNDATNYCNVLTQRDRLAGTIPANYHYRLPTEAEWEYACRAGTSERFHYGNDDDEYPLLKQYGWHYESSSNKTHTVGELLPNPWGLFDMYGNVWEWCLDWYSASYPGGSVIDPQGPANGSSRVIRGGSYVDSIHNGVTHWRSASRGDFEPQSRQYNKGFRLVISTNLP